MIDSNYYDDKKIDDSPKTEINTKLTTEEMTADAEEMVKACVEFKKLEDLSFIEKMQLEEEIRKHNISASTTSNNYESLRSSEEDPILTNYTLRQFNYKQMLSKCNLEEVAKLKKEFDEYFNARFDEKQDVKPIEDKNTKPPTDNIKTLQKELTEQILKINNNNTDIAVKILSLLNECYTSKL